jgi:hypothetical protein
MERRSLCPCVASSLVSEKPSVGVKKLEGGLLASTLSFLFASGW